MQTILGSGGAIATELAKALTQYTTSIRLVSRHPKKVNETDELFTADFTDPAQIERAISGSEIVYVTVGFEYKLDVWQRTWPPFMRAVLDACSRQHAKLVFFDNVYMYDIGAIPHMTEESPMRPPSKKGMVRAQIAQMLLDDMKSGKVNALIARSADFLSPTNSLCVELVYNNFAKGKKANWFIDVNHRHNFTYSPDAGIATALLGNTPDAYGQIWHLPSDRTPLTGKDWITLFAKEMGVEPKYSAMPQWLLTIVGVFVPILREFKEMTYQYNRDYFFDSSKFEKRFGMKPTSPAEAVRGVIRTLKK
ncbi:MAG TPA: NAD-dependent epimerase/dehydratase family protein [Bacteroidota bacterium]|nr:NAD-dependent epimerase/dehydratase family protein [Bacteroidota bacterium]